MQVFGSSGKSIATQSWSLGRIGVLTTGSTPTTGLSLLPANKCLHLCISRVTGSGSEASDSLEDVHEPPRDTEIPN